MATGTDIEDPVALNRAGTGAQEMAGRTRTTGAHPVDETRSASKDFGSGNWDGGLGGALGSLADTWSSQVSALAANTPLIALGGVVTRAVSGISPSRFALAWRT